jgi:hypothetical protein
LRKEIVRLVDIGVLEEDYSSEWPSSRLSIFKKEGSTKSYFQFQEAQILIKHIMSPNSPPIVLQVIILLLSSDLMNGAEIYASRMILLLSPVSANALIKCSSLLIMSPTTNSVVGCNDFANLALLELMGLEEL